MKQSNRCLSANELKRYVEGERSPEMTAHIDSCVLCSHALAGIDEMLTPDQFEEAVGRVSKQFKRRIFIRKISQPRNIALALGSLVLFIITITGLKNSSQPTLFESNFTPFPNVTPIFRGEDSGILLQNAMSYYEMGEMDSAQVYLSKFLQNDPSNGLGHFYYGNIQLVNNRHKSAIVHFVRAQNDSTLGNKILSSIPWYIALAHIQLNNLSDAKSQLNKCIEERSAFAEKAQELLKHLNSSK